MAVAITSSSTTPHVLHHLLRPPPSQPPLLSYFLRPFCTTSTSTKTILSNSHKTQSQKTNTILFSSPTSPRTSPLLFSLRSFSFFQKAHNHSLTLQELEEEDQREEKSEGFIDDEIENDDKEDDIESESDNLELEDSVVNNADEGEGSTKEGLKRNGIKAPTLTVKEKKELASYAHGLGKKLKSQLIGKSGFTDNVATSFIETLEANELLKIKIHRTCPGELEDVVRRLEEATGSVVVGQIGRTVIIYRPSLTKMKAEEKRQQARRVYVRKAPKLVSLPLSRGEPRRFSGHGRRGSSRV
ncbi:CRS1 YhbY domain-containing protein [Salix suchowensis]|nr:CRS1 YhbY domain-containing protein [Salix suchowensis]